MSLYSERREAWSAQIEDYRSSGLSMREWCEKNEIPLHRLQYWLRELRPRAGNAAVEWAPVKIVEDTGTVGCSSQKADIFNGCVDVWIGVARIEVRPGFDPVMLSDVLKAVAAVC